MMVHYWTNDSPVATEENFRSLLRFWMDIGDKVLENHLMSAKNNVLILVKHQQMN